MHLLAVQPGMISDGSEAVDLGQTPGDIVVLSSADTELSLLARARSQINCSEFPSLRLASLLHLEHNMSVDLYVEAVIGHAKLVIVRLLGGRGYWPYGVDEILRICSQNNTQVAFLPGDDQPDAELVSLSTVPTAAQLRLWQYTVHGGPDNALEFLKFCADLSGFKTDWLEPRPLVRAGLYWPGLLFPDTEALKKNWLEGAPKAAIVFYRALVQAGNTNVIDILIDGLCEKGLNPIPVFVASLKDPVAAAIIGEIFLESPPDIILNATGFAVSVPGAMRTLSPFDLVSDNGRGPVVLQVVFSGGNEASWRDSTRGLGARDIAMNVALPEVDGRLLSRAVSFKGSRKRDDLSETDIVEYEPVSDRINFVCKLASNWTQLRYKSQKNRRLAIVLANYPNRDGRIGNGVGLDTPSATVHLLHVLKENGYRIDDIPSDSDALISRLIAGPTNDFHSLLNRRVTETLSLAEYKRFLVALPKTLQKDLNERWGKPEADPFFLSGEDKPGSFSIAAIRLGNVCVCLQPARGYNIDPKATYHDPDLVPPHNYLAFYLWLRREFKADAVCHLGKHGNLEWLPGKALALSEECWPEVALGALPNIYPFIVNDPGEGTQAKRRAGAVIIDHLTPPLTRAESYGPLQNLELLVDEYYEASGVDPRRLKVLAGEILELSCTIGLDQDCGITQVDNENSSLAKLDNYLCELKEMQIRDGLHIFGVSPIGSQLNDLLVALVRVPRGSVDPGDQSLHRALAKDLDLDFDPLDCVLGETWNGRKPKELFGDSAWRTNGDTVERLEDLAARLVSGEKIPKKNWTSTCAVLDNLRMSIRPSVEASGAAELKGLLKGFDGSFVEPGPSGAPTRGRSDVLPTGRNFFSVDTRVVPTPAAWTLGWKSASMLVERFMQDHGSWPRTMALSAWGTSNMRTGGDDIAQGLALMGVKPEWDIASRRVTGFEILPASILGRPRVDVTLRVSGFFRDAFPGLIDLFDSAVRAVADLDETEFDNPLAARVREDRDNFIASGISIDDAEMRAGFRVFGSKPGAYGAGLQALLDEKGWETDEDLSRAYVAWGGYAYGSGVEGDPHQGLFTKRLKNVEAVVQNQDNREHDILDSDDYYQFEGGITAAVRSISGNQPAVYHNDHSRPERPRIATLEEEVARIVRARVVNPKWIKGVMRHGYKGAFEMAATVDYLFAFAATAKCVRDHHFDAVFEAFLGDDEVLAFLEKHNPSALREMSERLIEAQNRGLWRPKLNSTYKSLAALVA
jgi:cobaltochelatase CobN